MEDKCFCHLNGYRVKDAEARNILNGKGSMGDIKVSSVLSKNRFILKNIPDWVYRDTKYEVNNNSITVKNNGTMEYSLIEYYIDGLKPNTTYTISFELLNENGQPRLTICSPRKTIGSIKAWHFDFTEIVSGKYSYTFITGDDTSELAMILYSLRDAYIENVRVTFSNIQIEEGSVATEYTSYFELVTTDYINGNKAMGNIKTGTITCKNLIVIDGIDWTSLGLRFKSINDLVTVEGVATSSYAQSGKINLKKNIKPGTYTLSITNKAEDVIYGIWLYNKDGVIIGRFKTTSPTVTITEEATIYELFIEGLTTGKSYSLSYYVQLEEGKLATEYTKPFELATIDDINEAIENIEITGEGGSGSVKGYYYYEMPIEKLLFGLNGNNNNVIEDSTCRSAAKDIVEKITKDGVRTPHIIISNSLDSYVKDGETVDLPAPRQIILNNLHKFTTDENIEVYTFEGIGDYHGIKEYEGKDLPEMTDITLVIEGEWLNGKFEVLSLTVGGDIVYLATKKYVDDMILLHGGVGNGESVDLTNYATKDYVDEAIQGIEIPEGSTGGVLELPYLNSSKSWVMYQTPSITLTSDELVTLNQIINDYKEKHLSLYLNTNGGAKCILASDIILNTTNNSVNLYGTYTGDNGTQVYNIKLSTQGSWSDGVYTATKCTLSRTLIFQKSDYLTKTNTTAFNPTADYHPATKKYVDTMIADLRVELQGE